MCKLGCAFFVVLLSLVLIRPAARGAYDLSAAHVNLSSEAMLWGEGFTVDTAIRNSSTVAFKVKYYLSADKAIGSGDYLLRTWNVGVGVKTERVQLTLPSTPISGAGREIYIGIMVDADSQAPETNENNNSNQGFGIDWRRINIGPPDARADGSSYKYYTMLSPAAADCHKYSGYQFVAPAGTSGNTWTITSGALPPGIVMSSAGAVSGTATIAGTYAFTLYSSGTTGGTRDFNCQMVVRSPRSDWFEDAKLGYWTMIYASDEKSSSVIESENTAFNANTQMDVFAASGAKFVIFAAFPISEVRFWPSEVPTGYSPKTNRDFVQEFINACHARGMKALVYMAIDPHDPGEYTRGTRRGIPDFLQWNREMYQELLLKGVDGFWFDGSYFNRSDLNGTGANGYWPWDWASMEAVIRTCNPDAILINNPGAVTNWWNTDDHGWNRLVSGQLVWEPASDIDIRTFEQFMDRTHANPPATIPSGYNYNPVSTYNYFMIPWAQDSTHTLWPKRVPAESAGMVGRGWSWSNTYLPVKSWDDLVRYLIKCWDAGSTVSLCTGPKQNGVFDSTEATSLDGIGNWMATYGAAAYQTKQGPRLTGSTKMYCTSKTQGSAENLYVFVLDNDKPAGSTLTINNWNSEKKIINCYTMDRPTVSLTTTVIGSTATVQNIVWSSGPVTVLCFETEILADIVADINSDRKVDVKDFAILAANWAACTSPAAPCNYPIPPYVSFNADAVSGGNVGQYPIPTGGNVAVNTSGNSLIAGWRDLADNKALLSFGTIGTITGKTIQSAKLKMYYEWSENPAWGDRALNVTAHALQSSWTSATTYNTIPAYANVAAGSVSVPVLGQYQYFGWYEWNVTAAVQAWANGSAANGAFAIQGNRPDDNWWVTKYFTNTAFANRPRLTITIPNDGAHLCGEFGYPIGDFNKDCYVDFNDLQIFSLHWLEGI